MSYDSGWRKDGIMSYDSGWRRDGIMSYDSGWRKDGIMSYDSGWRRDGIMSYDSGWRRDGIMSYDSGWRRDVVHQQLEFGVAVCQHSCTNPARTKRNVLQSFKTWGRSEYSHVCFAHCQEFLPCPNFDISDQFTFIFCSKYFRYFLGALVLGQRSLHCGIADSNRPPAQSLVI